MIAYILIAILGALIAAIFVAGLTSAADYLDEHH